MDMQAKTTLGAMFGDIFEGGVGDSQFTPRIPTEHTPEFDPRYVFELEDIRLMLMWDSARTKYARNLAVTGPTGSGKTALIFQFSARTGREVFRYSCHEKTDFNELLGTMTILKDGSTDWQDGPLLMAMKHGAILLIDEVNAARPGTLVGLNGVLDGAPSIVVPGSGEVVSRHPEFRIAVTGNSLNRDDSSAAFRGTTTMNAAFLDRFFVIEKSYLPQKTEMMAVQSYLQEMVNDPFLNPVGAEIPMGFTRNLVFFADSVREQFRKGETEITVSTRGLFAICEMVGMRWKKIADSNQPLDEIVLCARPALFNKATPATREGLEKAFRTTMFAAKFNTTPGWKVAGIASTPSAPVAAADSESVRILVNPRRQKAKGSRETEVAFWGYRADLDPGATCAIFYGLLTANGTTHKGTQSRSEAMEQAQYKQTMRGYAIDFNLTMKKPISGGSEGKFNRLMIQIRSGLTSKIRADLESGDSSSFESLVLSVFQS